MKWTPSRLYFCNILYSRSRKLFEMFSNLCTAHHEMTTTTVILGYRVQQNKT